MPSSSIICRGSVGGEVGVLVGERVLGGLMNDWVRKGRVRSIWEG